MSIGCYNGIIWIWLKYDFTMIILITCACYILTLIYIIIMFHLPWLMLIWYSSFRIMLKWYRLSFCIAMHFMNVDFHINGLQPKLYSFQKFDKRQKLHFPYTEYIKFLSNRAVHQAYNIVISQLVPILYISNFNTTTMDEIQILISTMCTNGFYKPWLLSIINKFLIKNQFPSVKIDIQKIIYFLLS
jgi:hypothetical protein